MATKSAEDRARQLVVSAFPETKTYELRVTDVRNSQFQRVDLLNKAGVVFPLYYFLVDMDDETIFFGDPHMNFDRMVGLADIGAAIKVGDER